MRVLVVNPGQHPELRWISHAHAQAGDSVVYVTGLAFTRNRVRRRDSVFRRAIARRFYPELARTKVLSLGAPFDILLQLNRILNLPFSISLVRFRNFWLDIFSVTLAAILQPQRIYIQSTTGALVLGFSKKHVQAPLVLNLPMPHYQFADQVHTHESAVNPEWSPFLSPIRHPPWKRRILEQELKLADVILVASTVTEKSLIEAGVLKRISRVPLGARPGPSARAHSNAKVGAPCHLLYAGRITQAKGLSYLFAALSHIASLPDSAVHLTVAGSDPMAMIPALRKSFPEVKFDCDWLGLPLGRVFGQGEVPRGFGLGAE